MPLSGINKKCSQCSQKCKQWSQIKVLICPTFKPIRQQAQEKGGNDTSPLFNSQVGELPVKQEKLNLEPKNANSMADRRA